MATVDSPESAGGALRELVARCLDAMEQDGPAALDALCAEHPSQAAALRGMIERLSEVGLLGGDEPFPERLGDFRLRARLGGGGMGVVYLAEQASLRRPVALKLIRPELLYFQGARERFRREVEAVARLAHPGIVPVLTGGEEGGIPYFAMELVQGATLTELLDALSGQQPARLSGADLLGALKTVIAAREAETGAGGSTSSSTSSSTTSGATSGDAAQRLFGGSWQSACLQIARAVSEALQHAHERGVLHRDVKPSNIMLTPDGRVLLLDFGLAQAAGNARVTRTGSHLGSLAYMSPEQVRGEHGALDARSDVYSLGASLYELLALRAPFAGSDEEDTRRRILDGRCAALRDLNAAVSRDAETVCQTAMELQPSRRYATAAALGADLGAVLARRPIAARRPGPLLKAGRWMQRNPAAAAALGLGALLLLGGPLGYALVQRRAAETERALNAELGVAFDRTLAAVDEMLTTVGADSLRDLPQFEPVRRQLLERALGFYRGLEADRPDDPRLRREQGSTHRSMAMLLRELGRDDEARPLFEQSLAELQPLVREADAADATADASRELSHEYAMTLCELAVLDTQQARNDDAAKHWGEADVLLGQLAAQAPLPPLWTHDHASALSGLALMAKHGGQGEDALQLFDRAAALLAAAVAAHPEVTQLAELRADVLNKASLVCSDAGRNAQAEELLAEAWAVYQTLLAADPQSPSVRNNALECASNYGLLLNASPDRALAESLLRTGFELARGLVADFPSNPEYRSRCAIIALNLVAELANQDRFADARPIALEAVAQLERLVAEQPDRGDMPFFLGAAYSTAAAVHVPLKELELALAAAQRGVELLRTTNQAFPDDPNVTAQLSTALAQLGDVERAQGDLDGARDTLDESLRYAGRRGDVLYQASEILARSAVSARDAAGRPADERHALRLQFEDRALDTLRLAVENGFTDFGRVRKRPEFATLRERPELEELISPSPGS